MVAAGEDVVSCDLAGGAALLNLESSTYYTLNQVASDVWQLIQEPKSVSEIRDALVARYEVDPVRCRDDLVALLDELSAAGLIRTVHATVA